MAHQYNKTVRVLTAIELTAEISVVELGVTTPTKAMAADNAVDPGISTKRYLDARDVDVILVTNVAQLLGKVATPVEAEIIYLLCVSWQGALPNDGEAGRLIIRKRQS